MSPVTRSAVRLAGMVLASLTVLGLALPTIGLVLQREEPTTIDLPTGLRQLNVDSDVGDITIQQVAAGQQPHAVARARWSFREPRAVSTIEGDALTLTGSCAESSWWLEECDVSWQVFLPPEVNLELRSSVGDITVVDTSGIVTATSSVGDVIVTGTTSTDLDLASSVGDIAVHALAPTSVKARSSTGDVLITLPADGTTYRVQARTSVGETTRNVLEDPASKHILDLSTSVGDIAITQQ